jgi:ribosome biogenesis protein NSA1
MQGIAGAITSMVPSPSGLISTSLDRYARVHSTYPPPPETGQPQDEKGAVLEKVYMKTIPTCVVWDGITDEDENEDEDEDDRMGPGGGDDDDNSGDDEDVWAGMQVAQDSENEGQTAQRRRTGRQ